MLAALQQRRPIDHPVALVVAHPDDETIAAGGSLHLMRRLLLVHVTDGAPRRLADAARAGFDGPSAYAAARERELQDALSHAGARPERVALGVPDQDATAAIPAIVARLRALFAARGIRAVLTHAYEGGHPDHDAVALAVQRAASVPRFEFAGYHRAPGGGMRTGCFLDAAAGDPVALGPDEAARKRAMIACFRTQAAILAQFDPACERFRAAPDYDFARPPHEGMLLYEEWGWADWRAWRAAAAEGWAGPCAA